MRTFYLVAPFLGGALPTITNGAYGLIEPEATVHGSHEPEHAAASRLLRAQTPGNEEQEDRAMTGIRGVGGVLYDAAENLGFKLELAFIDFMDICGYDHHFGHLDSLRDRTLAARFRRLTTHFSSNPTDKQRLEENLKVLRILEQENGKFMTAIVLSAAEGWQDKQYLERLKGVQRMLFEKWRGNNKSPETISNELYGAKQFIQGDEKFVDAIVAKYKQHYEHLKAKTA